jgi:stress-induced morphogen
MWQYEPMPTTPQIIADRIRTVFPEAVVDVRDTTGGGDHFAARVVSAAFANHRPVQRHQMVYAALGELMDGPIHALSLTVHTPDEPESKKP